MDLTSDQIADARARGCSFSPATGDQIRRFSAQRRIFQVDGLPFVAARDGFFETWATLAALIEEHRPAAAEQGAAADAAPGQEHDARSGAEPPPAPAEPEAARTERNADRTAAARRRGPGPPRPEPAPASDNAPPTGGTVAEPSEAEEVLPGVEAAQGRGPGARVVKRWRAGEPPTPRWMAAGKMRRGRLK